MDLSKKKNNKNSETLSKNEKLILSEFREESKVQKNELREITDFNINLYLNCLDDNLNIIIEEKILLLNTYLKKLELTKNKKFKDFKEDLSELVNNLFLLIRIDDWVDLEIESIKKALFKEVNILVKDDRNYTMFSDLNARLKNIILDEIEKLEKHFRKIVDDLFELYKTEIVDIEIKNKNSTIEYFLNSYLKRLTQSCTFIDENNQEINISFKRSDTASRKLFFEFYKNNFTGNVDKKSLEKLSQDFNNLITKNINGVVEKTEYLSIINEDGLKLSKKINPDGSIKYSGFENNFKNYSYKELNKLALEKGFKLDRQKGDHAIFIKKLDTEEKIIIIPQGRVIGKGLQATIIKNLNQN